MRSLDLAVEMRRPWADVDVPDVQALEMPMKARLELRPVVGLHDVNPEREPAHDIVHELDGRPLVAGVEDLQHADARAVIDRRELVEPRARARNPLEKLHIDLQTMARLPLLVPLPPLAVWPVFLIGRQPIQAMAPQNAMD